MMTNINETDIKRELNRTTRHGMSLPDPGLVLKIELHFGFELGSVYETFGYEWTVEDPKVMDFRFSRNGRFPIKESGSTLDIALNRWLRARKESMEIQSKMKGSIDHEKEATSSSSQNSKE